MKRVKSWSIIILPLIIILWVIFGIIPFLDPEVPCKTTRLLGVSFSAATALFTGIAFAVAFRSLFEQQKGLEEQQASFKKQQENLNKQLETLNKQTNLSVFADSMRFVMNSQYFNRCREYIYSDNFTDDMAEVRKILYKEKNHPISLDDYRHAIQSLTRTEKRNEEDKTMKKKLSGSYEKIKFFCMRMEFLGVIVSRENAAEDLIVAYYGQTIEDTYEKLDLLLKTTRKNKDSANLYMYYTELYNKVKAKKNISNNI